jgi:hypothetical protein
LRGTQWLEQAKCLIEKRITLRPILKYFIQNEWLLKYDMLTYGGIKRPIVTTDVSMTTLIGGNRYGTW